MEAAGSVERFVTMGDPS